jgi:hypothetical protein
VEREPINDLPRFIATMVVPRVLTGPPQGQTEELAAMVKRLLSVPRQRIRTAAMAAMAVMPMAEVSTWHPDR